MPGPAPEFHVFLPQMRMTHEAIVARARAAEAAGFDGIAFMDHLAPPLAAGHEMWEAMSIAAWVLAHTTTLTVGHLVLCDALRHPAVLARQITSLDHASGGRFELGIGWGSVPEELTTFGIGTAGAADRVARLGETLSILRGLWSGEVVDHQGRAFALADAQQRPVPTRPIPITIGGVAPRTLALVREHADWWNVPVHLLDRLDDLRDQAGGARVSVQTMVALLPTEGERDEVTARADRRFAGPLRDRMVIGTAGQVADHVRALHGNGVDRVYLWFADFAPVETLALAAGVIGEVRGS
jgi:alkanesulfonate monooxygenase SsuD/methylene tetrahydromethanopterin reductase-like flavin-dependent oxidoreductase (luciferase family)